MPPIDPVTDVDNGGLPPRTFWEVYGTIERLREPAKTGMLALVDKMDEDFWDKPRREQILELLNMRGMRVTQTNIAAVMDVANSLVTRIKRYQEDHPDEVFRMRGRPSVIGPDFEMW